MINFRYVNSIKQSKVYLCFYVSAIAAVFSLLLSGSGQVINGAQIFSDSDSTSGSLILPGEVHFKNIKQLTFEGENAEAYFSLDGTKLSMQRTGRGGECDQIFTMDLNGGNQTMVSTGKGKTTCAYYMPNGTEVLFASTHLGGHECPQKPDFSQGYVWAIDETYDIFVANEDGTNLRQLTDIMGYDAEATVSLTGDRIVFTSTRNGDLDIYSMNVDGSDVKQLTDELGYDGGAFFSADGKKIVYRRTKFESEEEKADYKRLLGEGLIRPGKLEIWVMDADGSNKRQVTDNGAANFAPYFFPDGERILFCSNLSDPKGRNFDIYKINLDGTGLERITFSDEFDGFPIFSPDGKKLVFCSNRNNEQDGETNVFICDWID